MAPGAELSAKLCSISVMQVHVFLRQSNGIDVSLGYRRLAFIKTSALASSLAAVSGVSRGTSNETVTAIMRQNTMSLSSLVQHRLISNSENKLQPDYNYITVQQCSSAEESESGVVMRGGSVEYDPADSESLCPIPMSKPSSNAQCPIPQP